MYTKLFLISAMFAFSLSSNANTSSNSGLVFPPKDVFSTLQYPPKIRAIVPQAPVYQFGQPYQQNTRMIPAPSMNQWSNLRPPALSQRPVMMNRGQQRNYSRRTNNNSFPFSNNMMPFGNNNGFNPFSGGSLPFTGNGNSFGMPTNPMNNMFGKNSGANSMPFFNNKQSNRKKAWGDKRNIWPDFYTDFTDEAWDTVTSGPRSLGTMPGGWRFPYISTPDPVTVSDAITNQFPPIMEEGGNMMNFSDWGVFDNK